MWPASDRCVRVSTLVLCLAALGVPARAQDTSYPPLGEGVPGPEFCGEAGFLPLGGQLPGPGGPDRRDAWLADLRHWRAERLIRAGFDDADYRRAELAWTQRNFVQHVMMIHDRGFYDPIARAYTVDAFLDDLERRFGGIDSILVWHSYPNLGIDDRNQYDLVRDMPGGIEGVKAMVDAFHRRGVRVLFPINLWDQGTRPEGVADPTAIARLMAAVGADGLNGDTLAGFPQAFRVASDQVGHALVLEPTDSPPAMALGWNTMSWGICWKYSFEPLVSTFKWLEPRHMVHVAPRWGRERINDLQFAFFNGIGFVSWENIWGIWNMLIPRDREALRRVMTIERHFAETLTTGTWEPFAPTRQAGVYASAFRRGRHSLWTMINRNDFAVGGAQLTVSPEADTRYYDLWHGVELKAEGGEGGLQLVFDIDGRGFGAILEAPDTERSTIEPLLDTMRQLSSQRLAALSTDWQVLPQRSLDVRRTAPSSSPPPGMVRIPGGTFSFEVSGTEIEGGEMAGVDVQYPWEDSPRRHHLRTMAVEPFFIDRTPVTNAEFKRFLDATGYRPADDHNFLRHWEGETYPPAWANKPVIWVSLGDARAYAAWAGKRLPREWEWQYAAQGTDGRHFPWGNDWRPEAVPVPDKGRTAKPPDDVGAHPAGASPFGVLDLVGHVWQWTDEYEDDHTRSAILRGGSYYQPQGSRWYFPQAYRLDQHSKYLLMAPSLDRAGTVGFRCVRDAQ